GADDGPVLDRPLALALAAALGPAAQGLAVEERDPLARMGASRGQQAQREARQAAADAMSESESKSHHVMVPVLCPTPLGVPDLLAVSMTRPGSARGPPCRRGRDVEAPACVLNASRRHRLGHSLRDVTGTRQGLSPRTTCGVVAPLSSVDQ